MPKANEPASIIRDPTTGNPIGVVLDGTVYRFRTETKLTAGTEIVGLVGVDPAQTGGLALEATLQTIATQATLAAVQAVLEAIRDTSGVKKITDALPSGDNTIGKVKALDGSGNALASATAAPAGSEQALITRNIPSGRQDVVIKDGSGNAAGVVEPSDEEDTFRLQTETRLVDEDGNRVDVATEDVNALAVRDAGAERLLLSLLDQLTIMNLHLQTMTGLDSIESFSQD